MDGPDGPAHGLLLLPLPLLPLEVAPHVLRQQRLLRGRVSAENTPRDRFNERKERPGLSLTHQGSVERRDDQGSKFHQKGSRLSLTLSDMNCNVYFEPPAVHWRIQYAVRFHCVLLLFWSVRVSSISILRLCVKKALYWLITVLWAGCFHIHHSVVPLRTFLF